MYCTQYTLDNGMCRRYGLSRCPSFPLGSPRCQRVFVAESSVLYSSHAEHRSPICVLPVRFVCLPTRCRCQFLVLARIGILLGAYRGWDLLPRVESSSACLHVLLGVPSSYHSTRVKLDCFLARSSRGSQCLYCMLCS